MVTVPPLSLRQTIFDWYAETRKARVLLLKRVDGPEQWVSSVWDPQLRRSAASSYSDTALATGRRSTTDVTCETRTSVSSPQHMAFASTAPFRVDSRHPHVLGAPSLPELSRNAVCRDAKARFTDPAASIGARYGLHVDDRYASFEARVALTKIITLLRDEVIAECEVHCGWRSRCG